MMELNNIPITVVIKAPNQRVNDHSVECMLGWTVKKLKQHLSSVYPSKPHENHQRLIYSGKLLQDHLQLKDFLREQESQREHTVHLVCLQDFLQGQENVTESSSSLKDQESASLSASSSPSSLSSPGGLSASSSPSSLSSPGGLSATEGVRQRHPTQLPQHPNTSNMGPFPQLTPDMIPGITSAAAMMNPAAGMMNPAAGMMNPAGGYWTQEQYMQMMQQYYYQVASHYMQYQSTGVYPTPPNTPTSTQEHQVPGQAPVVDNARPPADRDNMVMNAQGGMMAADDEDEDFGQRDWLDYVYMLGRVLILFSIVYFYSNLTRFILVFLFFALVYMYQTGWFTVKRRQVGNTQTEQAEEENVEHEQQDESSSGEETDDRESSPPEEPPAPGFLATTWCFVSTFFTSLIPQPPPAVDAN